MAHRALTLKYRPQVFADMVGQDHVSMVLARALEGGRIAHAYLFTGARGVGKTTSARILAKSLNCQRRASGELEGADPCNTCTSCLEITSGVSLDVAEIDGASNRGIADVQALREKVRFSPTGGRFRVVIIDEVHQLSNDAFAALLKTLEEPPPHLVFIFATTDPQKLPDTIRSRTQRFDFARVPVRKVADRLLDIARRETADADGVQFKLTEGAALLIAQKSEGALRDAVGALDQVISSGETDVNEDLVRRILGIADREAFFTLADAIVAHDPQSTLRALHAAFEKGMDPRDLAEGLSEHIRHIMVLKVDPKGEDLVPATREEIERMRAQGRDWSENDLLRLLKLASEVLQPMKDSPQPLVHLEAAALQMATLEPGETLAELLLRLEALERRLGGAAGPSTAGRTAPSMSAGARSEPTPASAAAGRPGATIKPGTISRTTPRGSEEQASVPVRVEARASAAAMGDAARAWGGAPSAMRASTDAAIAGARVASRIAVAVAEAPRSLAPSAPAVVTATMTDNATTTTATAVAEAPPSDGSAFALDDTSLGCWRAVIEAINGRKRMLGAFLEESRFLGIGASALALATDDLHRAVIEESENKRLLAEEVRRAFGRSLELLCGEADALGAPPLPPRPEPEDVQTMIDRAIAWFDGEKVTPPAERPRDQRPANRFRERNL
jgi:DNA polymerase III subunit gamma/tau